MSLQKTALLIALAAAGVHAVDPSQSAEINVILSDAKAHLADYMSIVTTLSIPPAVLEIGMAMATATDDSYTTYYSQIDFDEVNTLVTELPWYSSRIQPALASALATISSEEPTSTSAASSSAETSSSEASSSKASSSSDSSQNTSLLPSSTSSSEASSSSEVSSSTASSKSSSSSEVSSATSSKTSSEAKSSSTVSSSVISSQTTNGAAKAALGMGVGFMGAAAFLL